MKEYKRIVQKVLDEGKPKQDRTGMGTIATSGVIFEHHMSEGFPLLTTKYVPFHLVSSELEFFIKGYTSKAWLQERNNHIWDEWCSPSKVPYGHDEATLKKMLEEDDLGPIYGYQWRCFGRDYDGEGKAVAVDQLVGLVNNLKRDEDSRRMLVLAWNPLDLHKMALPPCHYGFQVTVIDGELNLMWNQRSVDVALGLPFNIASYGLLLCLLAEESGLKPGKLTGFLADTHIYTPHIDGLKEQITREELGFSTLKINDFTSIFDWKYTDAEIVDYAHHPHIGFEIAV